MRRYNIRSIVMLLVAFAAGIMVSTLYDLQESPVAEKIEDHMMVSIEPVDQDGMQWVETMGIVIGKSETTGENYEVIMSISDGDEEVALPLSWLEYKILEVGDFIDLFVVYNKDQDVYEYVDWVRDPKGRLVTHINEPIVVVDAGHGGDDLGEGSNGLWVEKDMVLKMALEMQTRLKEQGVRVIMTRDDDSYIDLYDRVALANYVQADMFVSCHLNRMDKEARGVEVLYSSRSEREFANELAYGIAGQELDVYSVYNRKSQDILRSDYYFVHKYCDSPSYIIEFGFADNEEDSLIIEANWPLLVDRASDVIGKKLQ